VIDTPWTDAQARERIARIEGRTGRPPRPGRTARERARLRFADEMHAVRDRDGPSRTTGPR
jgi:hypothetical protein